MGREMNALKACTDLFDDVWTIDTRVNLKKDSETTAEGGAIEWVPYGNRKIQSITKAI